jgi:hypothetical protein
MNKYTGTTILFRVFTNYGNPKLERIQSRTLRLEKDKEIQDLAEIQFF